MSHDYGPLRIYEITWKSGHVETVQGHQIMFDSHRVDGRSFVASLLGAPPVATATAPDPRFTIHGMFGEQWRLVVSAPEAELHSLRDVTDREQIPGEVPS